MSQGGFKFIAKCRIHTSSDTIEFSIWEYLSKLFVGDRKRRGKLNVGFAKILRIDDEVRVSNCLKIL